MRHGTHSHTPPQDCTANIRCKKGNKKKQKNTRSADHLRLNRKKKYQDRAIERAVTFCSPRSRPGSPGSASARLRRRRCRNRQSRRLFSAVRPGGLAESRGPSRRVPPSLAPYSILSPSQRESVLQRPCGIPWSRPRTAAWGVAGQIPFVLVCSVRTLCQTPCQGL